jgi:4a-hydroxytetrahydrobiopterin dehydratase
METRVKKLSAREMKSAVALLHGWRVVDEKIFREFRFEDFSRAFAFMTACAIHAEKKNHHPEWFNVYNVVKVWLVTHDVKGISKRDLEMARFMNHLYSTAADASIG